MLPACCFWIDVAAAAGPKSVDREAKRRLDSTRRCRAGPVLGVGRHCLTQSIEPAIAHIVHVHTNDVWVSGVGDLATCVRCWSKPVRLTKGFALDPNVNRSNPTPPKISCGGFGSCGGCSCSIRSMKGRAGVADRDRGSRLAFLRRRRAGRRVSAEVDLQSDGPSPRHPKPIGGSRPLAANSSTALRSCASVRGCRARGLLCGRGRYLARGTHSSGSTRSTIIPQTQTDREGPAPKPTARAFVRLRVRRSARFG